MIINLELISLSIEISWMQTAIKFERKFETQANLFNVLINNLTNNSSNNQAIILFNLDKLKCNRISH